MGWGNFLIVADEYINLEYIAELCSSDDPI